MARTRATLPARRNPRARAPCGFKPDATIVVLCIIPFGRGNARSCRGRSGGPMPRFGGRGHGEIVLTGVDVTSYGPDIGELASVGWCAPFWIKYLNCRVATFINRCC